MDPLQTLFDIEPLTRAQIVNGTGFAREATFVQLSAPIAQALTRYPAMLPLVEYLAAQYTGDDALSMCARRVLGGAQKEIENDKP